jgi:hypothetical protein
MKRPEPKESVNLNRGRLLFHRRSSGAPGEAWLI